jgi:hypothetical protein
MRAISPAAPTRHRGAVPVPGGLSANPQLVEHAHAVVVLRARVARSLGRASLLLVRMAPVIALAAPGRVRGRERIRALDAVMSRAFGLRERALPLRLHRGATSANALAVRLAKAAPLAARAVCLARDAPLPVWLTLSSAQALTAAVPIRGSPRASDFRRCYLGLG